MDAKKLYLDLKKATNKYKEEIHCPMILDVMNNEGTMTAFCKKALISDGLFYKWTNQYKVFNECYQIGKIISRANWEEQGSNGIKKKTFNLDYWRLIGASRYGMGRGRVRMGVDPGSNPYDQYKQLINQASQEEFSASEIKQLMESINVGIRAYESFELQHQVDQMKSDLERMKLEDANNHVTVADIAKAD